MVLVMLLGMASTCSLVSHLFLDLPYGWTEEPATAFSPTSFVE
jgi:hypothetical protein